jgi:GTP-binding protein EngB required for normal cell division
MFGLELFHFIIKKSLCQKKSDHDLKQYIVSSGLGNGNYLVRPSKRINVLLVGRSQTGKTTIAQTLIHPEIGTSSTGFSDIRDPAYNS